MQSTLQRADSAGPPTYLEATSGRNAELYERLGFLHMGVLELPEAGPPLWPMRRSLDANVKAIIDFGTIEVRRSQRDLWRAGGLLPEWKLRFPELFENRTWASPKTSPTTTSGVARGNRAVSRDGLSSAGEKYAHANLPDDVLRVLRDRTEHGPIQGPALLVYDSDMSDWFFCEVRGPGDRRRSGQMSRFERASQQ